MDGFMDGLTTVVIIVSLVAYLCVAIGVVASGYDRKDRIIRTLAFMTIGPGVIYIMSLISGALIIFLIIGFGLFLLGQFIS